MLSVLELDAVLSVGVSGLKTWGLLWSVPGRRKGMSPSGHLPYSCTSVPG